MCRQRLAWTSCSCELRRSPYTLPEAEGPNLAAGIGKLFRTTSMQFSSQACGTRTKVVKKPSLVGPCAWVRGGRYPDQALTGGPVPRIIGSLPTTRHMKVTPAAALVGKAEEGMLTGIQSLHPWFSSLLRDGKNDVFKCTCTMHIRFLINCSTGRFHEMATAYLPPRKIGTPSSAVL